VYPASGATVNCTGGYGESNSGEASLYIQDVTCCWRVEAADGSAISPLGSCQAVRQSPYPYIASLLYTPAAGPARQERIIIQCCEDRTLAPNLCLNTTASFRGRSSVTVFPATAPPPGTPPGTRHRRRLAEAQVAGQAGQGAAGQQQQQQALEGQGEQQQQQQQAVAAVEQEEGAGEVAEGAGSGFGVDILRQLDYQQLQWGQRVGA
jgi:hypothetical protein